MMNNNQKLFKKIVVNIKRKINKKQKNRLWSYTLVNSDTNVETIISQLHSEGNRMYFRPKDF